MSIIIPYDEELIYGNGGYISLNGEISYCPNPRAHEEIARFICCGPFNEKRFVKSLNKKELNYDIYNGKLNRYQFEIFKIWMEEHYKNNISFYGACSDFLLHVIGYDKTETVNNGAITTCNDNPHVRLFNYYLLDHLILHLPRKIYNQELGIFETEKYIYTPSDEDIEMEKEIKEIKQKVPIKERKLFLK